MQSLTPFGSFECKVQSLTPFGSFPFGSFLLALPSAKFDPFWLLFWLLFTVPEPLRAGFAAQPEAMHEVLFNQSAATLQQVAAGPRLLGAELGFVGVLHTWGRQLQHHPHVHYVVPGGGLCADGKKWVAAKQADWLLPVKKLAALFRGRMEEAWRAGHAALHAAVPDAAWRRPWVVHCQPAGSGENVVKYLARYVARSAISDERIVRAGDEVVVFNYTDTQTRQRRQCTLMAEEFMRRYLQHVPPPGQHRVRYFGWMHPSAKRRRLQVETLLAKRIVVTPAPAPSPAWHLQCPHCERFTLVRVGTLPRQARAPPRCAR